jgi:hypothetical protein
LRIEEFGKIRRDEAQWEPFMRSLDARLASARRPRPLSWAAAAALAAVFLGLLALLPGRPALVQPLRAEVPAVSAPLFTPAGGTALTTAGGVLVLPVEDRT